MNESIVETRTVKIRLDDNDIIRIVTKPGIAKQTLSDAVENMNALENVRLGKKRPLFVDIRAAMSTDAEGRKYYSRPELADHFTACAFIVSSPVSRVIGSFFLGLNKLPFPVRLFTSDEGALEWLKEFLE